MASVAESAVIDVHTYVHGSDTYLGIASISFTRPRARFAAYRPEGNLRPTAIDKVGTDGLVTLQVTSRSASTLVTLADQASGTVTVKGYVKGGAGATQHTFTFSNVQYESSGGQLSRDADGSFTLSGVATEVTQAAA